MYDVIIIGMGISGITAAIYGQRKNLKILLLGSGMPGGMLNNLDTISNYPGLINIKGSDFALNLFNQVEDLKIPYKLEEVLAIDCTNDTHKVKTKQGEYLTKNIILATGKKPRFLGLEHEKELFGKGLSTCATCDGHFYKGMPVAVVGNNKQALEETLYLANLASRVYLLNEQDAFNVRDELKQKINDQKNIIIKNNVKVTNINLQEDKINSLTLSNGEDITVNGLFIYRGYLPNTDLVQDLGITNALGYIEVNEKFETKIKGLYAIGDVIKKDIYQLVTAASDGAEVINYLHND